VQIGYNEFQCRLDNQGRIWANSNNLKDYIDFYLENVFIFTKKDQDKYKLVLAHY